MILKYRGEAFRACRGSAWITEHRSLNKAMSDDSNKKSVERASRIIKEERERLLNLKIIPDPPPPPRLKPLNQQTESEKSTRNNPKLALENKARFDELKQQTYEILNRADIDKGSSE